MNRHRRQLKAILRPPGRVSALKLLASHLETLDEAAWYAARLELLGQILFGDLWKTDPRRNSTDTEKLL